MKHIEEVLRTVERRVISMYLTAHRGGHTKEQNDMACAYARRAWSYAMDYARHNYSAIQAIQLAGSDRMFFLYKMMKRETWEDSNETAEHEA